MANHYRKMVVHGDHLEAPDKGPPWTILWDTKTPHEGRWNSAHAETQESAVERATRFAKLGFVVHAIKDPSGAVFLDQGQIAERFGVAEPRPESRRINPASAQPEQAARRLVRGFVEEFQAMPGRVLKQGVVRAFALSAGISVDEFESAVRDAAASGWLSIAGDSLTLTRTGHAAATE